MCVLLSCMILMMGEFQSCKENAWHQLKPQEILYRWPFKSGTSAMVLFASCFGVISFDVFTLYLFLAFSYIQLIICRKKKTFFIQTAVCSLCVST